MKQAARHKPSEPPLLEGLSAVRIFVSDLDRALDFYASVLNLKVSGTDRESWLLFKLTNALLLVEVVDADSVEFKDLVGRFTGMSFDTADIEQAHKRLLSLGVRFEGPPERQDWGGSLAHFQDPDGNILTLVGN